MIIEAVNMQSILYAQFGLTELLAQPIVWAGLADIKYDGQLSATAYVILAVVLLGIIAGLGWCFYRAVTAAGAEEPQSPDEIGDEKRQR